MDSANPPSGGAGARPKIHGYEILGELGRGGMGVVYKARQVQLKRIVALKMILAGAYAGQDDLLRFRTEAEAVARLQHPNIVQLYEIGEQDSRAWFSLEFVDGGSLADQLDGAPKPERESAQTVETLARAIQHAHEHGILHRDLTPVNVLLTRDGQPKISDFGLAKEIGGQGSMTQDGSIMGTPEYMAPEQAAGLTQTVGPTADIYALGSILYEMLTGRPPFQSANFLDTLEQVRSNEPVPPSRLLPRLSRDLETICLKCLEKEPQKRYGAAGELADDLRRFLNEEPIRARPASRTERIWRWSRRNPALATASVLAAAAVLIATGLSIALAVYKSHAAERLEDKQRLTELALGEAEHQRQLADQRHVEAMRLLAESYADRGLTLCEQGDVPRGVLWLAKALEIAHQADAPALESALRYNLASWRPYLERQRLLLKVTEGIQAVAFSPRGDLFATGSVQGKLDLWDAATGRSLDCPAKHAKVVWALAFSPDGNAILTGSGDTTARLWKTATGEALTPPLIHPGPVYAVAFTRDGRSAFTGCEDGIVRRWNLATGKEVGTPLPHPGIVHALALSPDGQTLATGCGDNMGRLWDTASGKPRETVLQHAGPVSAVAYSHDGRLIATGSHDRVLRLWDADGKLLGAPIEHRNIVQSVAFSPDGQLVLTACRDFTARLWRVTTRAPVGPPIRHHGWVSACAFSPDGRSVLTGSTGHSLKLERIGSEEARGEPLPHGDMVWSVALGPDGKKLATACEDRIVRVWNLESGQLLGATQIASGTTQALAFSPNGKHFAAGQSSPPGKPSQVVILDADACKAAGTLPHAAGVRAAAYSPDGQFLLTGCDDGTVQFWDAKTLSSVGAPVGHKAAVVAVAFSPDGSRFASAGYDRKARIWDTKTRQQLGPDLEHQDTIRGLAFSPKGDMLLTAGWDKTVRRWKVATGEPLGMPLSLLDRIHAVAFTPDGELFVTASADGTAQFWHTATHKPVGPPLLHDSLVHGVAIRRDGMLLVTASGDHTARRWATPARVEGDVARIILWAQAETGMELDAAGAPRSLSDAEKRAWGKRLAELGPPRFPRTP